MVSRNFKPSIYYRFPLFKYSTTKQATYLIIRRSFAYKFPTQGNTSKIKQSTETQEIKKAGKRYEHQNERLKSLIAKSKFLTKLQTNPMFSRYFDRITNAGTISIITSFFILHELTAIIPLFTIWYLLYNLNMMENIDFSGDLLCKCSNVIERLVGDKCDQFDKHRLIVSGALSYAFVKILGPVRIFVSLWGAPYFSKWLVLPFRKIQTLLKK